MSQHVSVVKVENIAGLFLGQKSYSPLIFTLARLISSSEHLFIQLDAVRKEYHSTRRTVHKKNAQN